MRFQFILVVALAALASQIFAELARIRMTQHGLDYTAGVVKTLIQADPGLQPGADLGSKKEGKTEVTLRLNHFTAPDMRVISVAPNVLRFTSTGGGIEVFVRGKWRQNRVLKGSISGTAKGNSFNLNLETALSKNANGKLQLTPGACSVSIGGLKVSLGSGIFKKLIQPITNLVVSMTKSKMYSKLCEAMTKVIVEKANPMLASSDMSVDIRENTKLDLMLAKNPEMTPAYFDVSFDGGIKEGGAATVPIPAAPIAASSLSANQIYFWLSDAAANGAFDFSQKQGLLQYVVGRNDLPEKHHEKLQTTCDGGILPPKCIGAVLPGVKQMYPDTHVYAIVKAREAPSLKIEEGKATIQMKAEMALNVENPAEAPIFKSVVDFKSTIAVRVENRGGVFQLVGELVPKSGEIKLTIEESHIGSIVDSVLEALIYFGEPIMLEYFNQALKKGYALPNIANIELVTPNLAFEAGALRIESSMIYKP